MSNEMTGTIDRVSNYYGIGFGKIVKSYKVDQIEGVPNIKKRTNKNGIEVYEVHTDFIKGHITNVELRKPTEQYKSFGEQIILTLELGGNKANLQFKFDSSYGRAFMQVIPNIDLSIPVNIQPYDYVSKKDSKQKIGMTVIQGVDDLDWCYTQENPNGMPPLVQTNIAAHPWDNTDQLNFFRGSLKDFAARVTVEANKELDNTFSAQESTQNPQPEELQKTTEQIKNTPVTTEQITASPAEAFEPAEQAAATKQAAPAVDEMPKKPQAQEAQAAGAMDDF